MNSQISLRTIAEMKITHLSSNSSIQVKGLALVLILIFFPTESSLALGSLEDYLRAIKDKRIDVRRTALEQLLSCVSEENQPEQGRCPEGDGPEAYNQLLTGVIVLLKDSDPRIRETAILYLKQSTDARVVKPIARLLRDVNDSVRATAAESFYLLKIDASIVRELEHLLMDKNRRVRMGAASALGFSGTKSSLDLLRGALARETDNEVRKLFTQAIQELER